MAWTRAKVDERCGSCNAAIAVDDRIFVFYPGRFARAPRRVRCELCGTSTFGPPPEGELAGDTTAPQPSFEQTPLERLPNVVSAGYLQARREAAVARWKARRGLS